MKTQLRAHGPATSWWTFPYKRLMGVTANIPFRTGRLLTPRRLACCFVHQNYKSHAKLKFELLMAERLAKP